MIVDVGNKTGTIKRRVGRVAAPHIRVAQVLFRFFQNGGKLRVGKVFLRHVIQGRLQHRTAEQVRPVAEGRHVEGISAHLFLPHDVNGKVGEVEVLQGDGADVVIVVHPVAVGMGVAVLVRPCFGFDVIPPLCYHSFRQDILAVKEHLQRPLYLVDCPRPLMPCGENGGQHIGVMLDLV